MSDVASAEQSQHVSFYKETSGIMNWVWTIDHKRIGIMYLIAVTVFFLFAVFLGFCLRMELMDPGVSEFGKLVDGMFGGTDGLQGDTYNRLLTMHGVIMIFLFIIPGIPAVFGNFFLPIMIGADDVALPKLNLLSWYCYVAGSIFTLLVLFIGGPDTGWTFYAPYSAQTASTVELALGAAFILGWSSILTGINFIVTIHRLRAPGMGWFDMPLFCWALYASAWMQVIATPVIGITLILLMLDKYLGIGIFDPLKGGDPVLFQHMFWIYSHPAVYIMIVPPMGIVSEIIATFCRRVVFGYKFVAFSSMGIAMIGSLVWAHHMYTAGMADEARIIFSFLTFLVALPSAVKIFNWIATMYKGSISLKPPMVYTLIFMVLFSIGGFSGLLNGALAADVHVHDTFFVVGHFHYVMFGGNGVMFFAGLLYWFPKMFGKMYNNTLIYISSILFFIGFNLLYGGMKWLGIMGAPRRYWDMPPGNDLFIKWNKLSTHGSWLMILGIAIFFGTLFYALFFGKKATDNPWGSMTFEWQKTKTPPVLLNFDSPPTMTKGPYDYPEKVEK